MRRNTVKVLLVAASMMMSMAFVTACGAEEMTAEEASQAVSEIKEDLDDAKEDISEAKEEVAESMDQAVEEISEAVENADAAKDEIIENISGDMDLAGSWQDEISKRACMDVTKNSDGSYDIQVSWGGSAFETAIWKIHGNYDSASGMLSYEDGSYAMHTFDEDGNETLSDETTTKGSFMKEGDKLRWQDSKNDGDGVFVRLSDEETGDASVEAPVVGDDYISVLPDYIYKGGDPIMAAVTQYMIVQYKGNYAPCDVSIPCPVIVDKDETDSNDVKVWGNFWLYNYMMNGDTLVSESGGSYPGLMHLKSTDAGYEVTSFEVVADGSDYDESAKQIFGDRYDKFISSNADDAANQKLRAEIISDYVKSHELAITKYQDTGWDPVELPQ